MAQAALKTCEICISAPGSHYCLDCRQYFCDQCKSMHTRIASTKNHKFESGSNVIPEVKSQCIEHSEDFVFACTSCNVPVCLKCINGKHSGHKVANIAEIISGQKKECKDDIQSKLNTATKILADSENALKTFEININSAIKAITEEGTKLKAIIDRQVAQMIQTLTEKAKLEKDKLSDIVADVKKVIERCNEINKQNDRLQTAREDADLIQKLKNLNVESDTVNVGSVPEFPSVEISKKTVTDKEIGQLLATYTISETKIKTTGIVAEDVIRRKEKQKKKDSKQKQYLYMCQKCGTEQISQTNPHEYFLGL